ncbi:MULTISPECIES: hypothetical protein [unclassified Streptomyces]|uniref:hypothetical protein n=1 Tax=unclassified Streptomyces TaxID=2593676 RepID=UPI0036B42616
MNSMLKKVVASLSAGAAMALGVVFVGASPAAAVERCEHQTAGHGPLGGYRAEFDFCIQADEGEVKVSVENFACWHDEFHNWYPRRCVVTGGMVQTLKNGISTYSRLTPLESMEDLGHWEVSLPGCEDGDFVKAFIDDLRISYAGHTWNGHTEWKEVAYRTPFVNSGVRC